MTVEKMSISIEPPLGAAIRAAAQEAGQPVSNWVATAVEAKLRSTALAKFLDEWQAEHGAFTSEEVDVAARKLGFRSQADPAA